ncbi:DUF4192 domain-containing protein [Georgenia yuyongxinii]|uniref:DUF4192 domain-containing protein n=2 Tax=Georgenia yuyongxinii TaxID=2589797 RepID=A0A552WWQ9_9MICO|nr:DUF4192 domain-containing protein [Georgenia yuyongxinii]
MDGMDDTVIRLSSPRDLLALVPYRLGFHPERSAVLIGTRVNERGRDAPGLVIRVDLADVAHPQAGPTVAAALARHLRADGAHDAAVVLYTPLTHAERAVDDGLAAASAALAAALPWVEDLRPWVVGPDGWRHLSCEDCCPTAGYALADLEASAVAAAHVLEGRTAVPSRAALAVQRVPAGPAREAAQRAAEEERACHRAVLAATGGAPLLRGAAFGVPGAAPARDQGPLDRRRRAGARLWDNAVAARRPRPGPEVLGRLLVHLGDLPLRDAVLARTTDGGMQASHRYLGKGAAGAVFGAPRRPDVDVLDAAMVLAGDVAAHSAPGCGAPALGVLAFLAWWSADGARADVVAQQALAEEPDHGLALLVLRSLEGAVPPPWYEPGGPW